MALSRRGHRGHPRYTVGLATLALAAGGPPALAQAPLPEDNSGTGQYVEPVPDAGGDRPSTPGRGDAAPGSLPPSTREALPGGAEGRDLESFATDPGTGAPATGDGDPARGRERGAADSSGSTADESAASAIVGAVGGEDGLAVPVLFAAIGMLTLAVAAAALRRRGRGGQA